jgi:hypothetical protein
LAEEIVVLGGKVAKCHFIHHIRHMIGPWIELGPPPWEASDYPPKPWHDQKLVASKAIKEE